MMISGIRTIEDKVIMIIFAQSGPDAEAAINNAAPIIIMLGKSKIAKATIIIPRLAGSFDIVNSEKRGRTMPPQSNIAGTRSDPPLLPSSAGFGLEDILDFLHR